jgi:trimethylamine--corrinoid protein Co-methyltransferase
VVAEGDVAALTAAVRRWLGSQTFALQSGEPGLQIVDAQAGLESGVTAVVGALAGINMISGAGMLDFLACFSPEKLVLDAEAIAMAKRLLEGMRVHTDTLATAMFEGINFKGEFLKQKVTRQLFAKEQHLPSAVIDRSSVRGWQEEGRLDAFARAKARAAALLKDYQPPQVPDEQQQELLKMVQGLARTAGLDSLPGIE